MTTPLEDAYADPRHELVGGAPDVFGPWQLALLVGLGMRPEHRLLDLGCGTLRAGLHFIDFLDPGRYVGADPQRDLLDIGEELIASSGLRAKSPSVVELKDLAAENGVFDWILTHSVLNHLDADGVVGVVRVVDRLLAPQGRWVSTIRFDASVPVVEPGKPHGRREGEYWRAVANPRWLDVVFESVGLVRAPADVLPHPRGMDVFVALRA